MAEVTDPALLAILEQPQTKINETEGATGAGAYSQSALDAFDRAIGTAERLKSHPGYGAAVGSGFDPQSWGSFNPFTGKALSGTSARDFTAELEAMKAQVFLPMVQSMKGMGALSDAEGKKLTEAIGALDTGQSEEAFRASLDRIIGDLTTYRNRGAPQSKSEQQPGMAGATAAAAIAPPTAGGGPPDGAAPSPDGSAQFATERDRQFGTQAQSLFDRGASRADLDALALSYGYNPYGPDLDRAIEYRNRGGKGARILVPESGFQGPSALGAIAASPIGAYFTGAANALTAGTLDEIVGATGGDAQRAQQAKDVMREAHPWASAGGELTGAALAMTGVGRAPGLGGRALLADAAYGGAYGAGESNDNRLGGAAVGAGAAAAGSYFGGKLLDKLTSRVPSAAATRYAEGQRYGIDMPLGAAGGRGAAIIDNTLSNMPGSAQVMQAGRDVLQNQVEEAVKGQADNFGTANTFQAMGDALQAGARKWISKFQQASGRAYDAIPIKPDQSTWPANTTTALRDMSTAFASNPKLADAMRNSRLERFMDALGSRGGSSLLSWKDLKAFRSAIGEEIGERRFSDNIATSQLRRLYGALSDDMRMVAEAQGPAALKAFDRANNLYRQGQERIDGALTKILGDDGKLNPEAAANRVMAMARSGRGSSDLKRLAEVRKSMPAEEWGDVASSLVRLIGQPARSEGRDFSAETFIRNYADMTDGAKNLLFADRGREGLKASLDGLVGALTPIAQRNALRNTSNTAGQVLTGSAFYMLGNLPALIGQAAGSYGAARLWTNPRFVRWATGYAKMMRGAQAAGGAPNISKQVDLLRKVAAAEPAIAAETSGLAQLLGSAANDNAGMLAKSAASGNEPDQSQ